MIDKEFIDLKEKINSLKRKSLEANGRRKAIEERWQKDYGFNDIDSARKKLAEIKQDVEFKEKKRDELFLKLQELVNSNPSD